LPKSFIAINLSEISPQLFGPVRKGSTVSVPDDENGELVELDQNTTQDESEKCTEKELSTKKDINIEKETSTEQDTSSKEETNVEKEPRIEDS
jgi:hypothetical protein